MILPGSANRIRNSYLSPGPIQDVDLPRNPAKPNTNPGPPCAQLCWFTGRLPLVNRTERPQDGTQGRSLLLGDRTLPSKRTSPEGSTHTAPAGELPGITRLRPQPQQRAQAKVAWIRINAFSAVLTPDSGNNPRVTSGRRQALHQERLSRPKSRLCKEPRRKE